MIKKRISLIAAILLTTFTQIFAHALWIETKATGKKGQAHEVKVYFGEYAGNERDSAAKWFSNMKEFTLWVTAPDGQKQQLTTTQATDHFAASFVLDEKGVYTISVSHEVRDVYGTSKLQYYSLATVGVDQAAQGNNNITNATALAVQCKTGNVQKLKSPVSVQVLHKNAPLSKAKVIVAAPTGWTKELETDENGNIQFDSVWPGRYMIEAVYTDKTPGSHNGKDYKAVWHCVTYCLDVK